MSLPAVLNAFLTARLGRYSAIMRLFFFAKGMAWIAVPVLFTLWRG